MPTQKPDSPKATSISLSYEMRDWLKSLVTSMDDTYDVVLRRLREERKKK